MMRPFWVGLLVLGLALWVVALGHALRAPYAHTAPFLALQAGTVALLAEQGRKVGIQMPCDFNSPLFALAAKQINAFFQDRQYILFLAFRVGQPNDIRVFLHEFV